MAYRSRVLAVLTLTALTAAAACRTGEPSSDPKTPANSPFPTIDRKEADPPSDAKRPPLLGDAG